MASPQVENGFTRIANELLDKLAETKVNGTQFRILMVVFRYTYGFQRKEHELSETFIANATSIHKQQVKRELKALIDRRIINVIKQATFTEPRTISFNKNYKQWKGMQVSKTIPGNQTDTITGSGLDTSTGSGLDTQKRKSLKKVSKEIYIPKKSEKELRKEIFDHYLSLKLIKHNKYTPAMDMAIKTAMKNNGYTIEDCKTLLDRHKKAVEATKGSEYSIRARPLHEFFGQKAYQAKHLICADYEKGGKYYDLQRPRRKQGPKKQMDFTKFPQHKYTEDELDNLFEKIEVEEMDYG
ncbi:MAG TPA: replication protein [Bacillota bacterium]|nr:replication protein [Bacillota bacterium]